MPARPSNLADPVVTFVTSLGTVDVQMAPQAAPVTVANFLTYVSTAFYDGVVFHRLFKPDDAAPAIVAQAGLLSAGGDGGYAVKTPIADPIVLESQNGLSNTLGTIGMARTTQPDTAAAQFYFNTADNASGFDYRSPASPGFAVFGRTIKGLDVLSAMSRSVTFNADASALGLGTLEDFPRQDIVIQTARATQFFSGKRAEYTISATASDLLVTPIKGGAATSVALLDRLQFKDRSLGINEVFGGELATTGALAVVTRDDLRFTAAATADEMFTAGRSNVTIDGAAGNDTLTGGTGADGFAFTTPLAAKGNVDTVFGLDPQQDTLLLGSNIFSAYSQPGAVPAADLVLSGKPKATAANHHLIYNTRTGDLAWDADGNGKQKPVLFVKLVGAPAITAADLVVFDPAA
jgi:peptidyl-prolyl cis-trans isomerase A (cyclophilin A)